MTALARSSLHAGLSLLPLIGVALFVLLYFCAAALYPGGTPGDPHTLGYSHTANYWCDLLDSVSYSGQPNPGRPWAVLATVLLPISLIPFWWRLPVLFNAGSRARPMVRITGSAAMGFTTLVFTGLHDLVINLASLLGFTAFLVSVVSLLRARRRVLVAMALLPLAFSVSNYLMWQGRWLLWAMPTVQKAAYATFFLWVVAVSLELQRGLNPGRPPVEGGQEQNKSM